MKLTSESLTPAQLEIISMFNLKFSDEELNELKKRLKDFLAEKAINAANKKWKEKGWTNKNVDAILKSHLRTPYRRNQK